MVNNKALLSKISFLGWRTAIKVMKMEMVLTLEFIKGWGIEELKIS